MIPSDQRTGRDPHLVLEQRLWNQGYKFVTGIDEAGRGAWAGPVVAAAVVLPTNDAQIERRLAPVRDSKLLSAACREVCYALVMTYALAWGVGSASSQEIDRLGIVPATRLAMCRAVQAMPVPPDYLVIDAVRLKQLPILQYSVAKADLHHLSVASASILAKVARDHWMIDLAEQAPAYGFARHKGYGTRFHQQALQACGVSRWHRFSYRPIAELLLNAQEAKDGLTFPK